MPAAPWTDMQNYLALIRSLPDVRLTDDETKLMLSQGKKEEVFSTLMKIVPFVAQRYIFDIHRREDYQDIIQEGNLAVWKCIESWRPRGMTIASWAHMYAKKAMITAVQRDLKYIDNHEEIDLDQDIDSTELGSDYTDEGAWEKAQESAATYRRIVARLSNPRDKYMLNMLKEGMTQTEISRLLNISQSRVSRVVRELLDCVKVMGA